MLCVGAVPVRFSTTDVAATGTSPASPSTSDEPGPRARPLSACRGPVEVSANEHRTRVRQVVARDVREEVDRAGVVEQRHRGVVAERDRHEVRRGLTGDQVRFDAVGRDRPSGHAVANVDAVGAVPVRFSTTAVAPWGTASATDSVNDSPGPSGPVRPTRCGCRAPGSVVRRRTPRRCPSRSTRRGRR